MRRCGTCGHELRGRGVQADLAHERKITCRWCGVVVVQLGPGRPWVTCRSKACMAKQRHYRRESGAALDRMEG